MGIDEILASPITWIVYTAASELIALSPMRENSVIEIIFHVLRALKGKRG